MAAENSKDKPLWSREDWLRHIKEMEELSKSIERERLEREQLSRDFAQEVLALSKSFFPGRNIAEAPLLEKLYQYMLYHIEDACFIVEYHLNETGLWYFKEAPNQVGIVLNIPSEAENAELLQTSVDKEMWDFMQELIREDYAEAVFYKSFQWHLARLFKINLGDFEPELYDLPARAFLELEVLASRCSSELLDMVMEQIANPEGF
ncbi:MAG: hypothetical protein AB7S69_01580 [Salinivirgaceae bacterium]